MMPKTMEEGNVLLWGQAGLKIADQTVRSWEAAAQYFKVSPKVVAYMPFNYFMKWTDCGSDLCRESPTLAARLLRRPRPPRWASSAPAI